MKQGEQDRAERGMKRPAVGEKQMLHGSQTSRFRQSPLSQISHENNRHDDLVGGKAEKKSDQDDAVQSHQTGKGVQKRGAQRKQVRPACMDVGHAPDENSCRYGDCGGSAQHKQRTVEDRAHENGTDLRFAVRRQLKREGGGHAAQPCDGEQPRDGERHADSQEDRKRQEEGGQKRGAEAASDSGEENGDQRNQRRKSAVAGDKAVGQDGQQSFPGGVDDPAAGHSGGVAAEPHGHAQRLLAAGMAALKGPIQIIGKAGQVSDVFEQREQREEDGHRRQHYGDDPGDDPVHSGNEQVVKPGRGAEQTKKPAQNFLEAEKEL